MYIVCVLHDNDEIFIGFNRQTICLFKLVYVFINFFTLQNLSPILIHVFLSMKYWCILRNLATKYIETRGIFVNAMNCIVWIIIQVCVWTDF